MCWWKQREGVLYLFRVGMFPLESNNKDYWGSAEWQAHPGGARQTQAAWHHQKASNKVLNLCNIQDLLPGLAKIRGKNRLVHNKSHSKLNVSSWIIKDQRKWFIDHSLYLQSKKTKDKIWWINIISWCFFDCLPAPPRHTAWYATSFLISGWTEAASQAWYTY